MLCHHAYGMERQPRLPMLVALILLLLPLIPSVSADDDIASSALMTDGNSVSGNVDKERLAELDNIMWIDIVSIGKITHSAKALDISLVI